MCKLLLCSEVLCFRFRFANWSKKLWWTKVWRNVYLIVIWRVFFRLFLIKRYVHKNLKGLHCGIVTQIVRTLIQTCPLFSHDDKKVFFFLLKRTFFISVDNGSFCNLFAFAEKFVRGLCLVLLWVQNHFGPSKSFWSSINCFGRDQFVLIVNKSFLTGPNYTKIVKKSLIWTWPKWFGLDQNNL